MGRLQTKRVAMEEATALLAAAVAVATAAAFALPSLLVCAQLPPKLLIQGIPGCTPVSI